MPRVGFETAGEAIAALKTGTVVTVSCAEGDIGHVYSGSLALGGVDGME